MNGNEAVDACVDALTTGHPYHLICLDIMMPEMDGQAALKHIRAAEERMGILSHRGAKIVMVTALDDLQDILDAFSGLCDGSLVKPIDGTRLLKLLGQFKLCDPAPKAGGQ